MTDEAYHTKNWLMRADELEEQWKRTRTKVMIIQSKLSGGVSNYSSSGKKDLITAQSVHEDLMLEYSLLQDQLDRELTQCLHEDNISIMVIQRMRDPFHRAILISKYICRDSLNTLAKNPKIGLNKSQLYAHHNRALEELAEILDSVELNEIPQPYKRVCETALLDPA